MTEAERQLDTLVFRARKLKPEDAVREVREYFRSLPPETARSLAESRPDQLGGLDGVPARLRYHANHLRLVAARDRLQAVVEGGRATRAQVTRFETLDEMLQPTKLGLGVDDKGNRIELYGHRQFLVVEPEGQGRLVEVFGDLDEARNVAVLVPGMDDTLDTVRSQSDRAQDIMNEAGPGTAAVMFGYRSPLNLAQAMSKECALEAAPILCRFQAGLDAEVSPDTKTTLIGYSYGAQVVGQALLHGVQFDRVALAGSPGIDPSVHTAAQVTPPGALLVVARSPGDYVAYAEMHGPDPASFPDAVRMETNKGPVRVRGHMTYFRLNSEFMRNLGRVIRGDLEAVTRTNTNSAQESKLLPGVSWAGALRGLAQSSAVAPFSKVFDGVRAFGAVSSPLQTSVKSSDGVRTRRGGGAGPHRPEGPAR